ncbi:MAG TPA: NADH-quinone oxidoreductase subunit J [Acidiphilium sp.]|nr:NADH-quinone oxidoreductase subunit J [Steroidobacteraceae bacterium]OYV68738.1 MAG: NADH-quinone oxidoreductase subunit J [Acidiphilium sp. 21-60-14]OYV89607.1 MAG: NADH-quinone oxidoreductase subunit J [Acidiphilium sp. 37-60-79]OZB39354.1 MAG: NADH-quinone oxidoreductase subunit J [Acidiphilium sp. 34-60-192]HQT88760.1 NADH-quinone oxidoreductase subunit J [Acidiphilium sp.]
MNLTFDLSAIIAVVATVMMLTRASAVHALLYLTVSLLAVSLVFFVLGAPFAAALEVIIYAGAIMVLFVFVIMMLNIGEAAAAQERIWLQPSTWIGPSTLALLLAIELGAVAVNGGIARPAGVVVSARQVGLGLVGPYMLAVEIASFLLLAGLVASFHLGRSIMRAE